MVALDALYFVARSKDEANTLIRRMRLYFKDGLVAGTGPAAGLLDQHSNGIGFIQQAQTPSLGEILAVARIHEDAAAHQDTMGFSHQRGNPPHVEITTPRARLAGETFVDIALDGRLPVAGVGRVDRELGRFRL